MGRRIEVELTSAKDDGTWTWRAAGAKQPKGVLDAKLLYEGAKVGDVVRAEADFDLDGIVVTAVLPPQKKKTEPDRLEIIGPPRGEHQGVTSSLVPKSERPRSPRGRDGERGEGGFDRRGDRPPRRDDAGRGQRGAGRARPEGRPRPDGARRPAAADGERPPRQERPRGERPRPAPAPEPAPKPKRLAPANVHRAAAVAALPPEQQPIAEQVLRGGLPAVRQAIDAQNARLREEGQPEVHAGPLVAIAEQLLPVLKAAEWRDRAEAAAKMLDDVSLRDLRSVVAGADLARDDEGRLLAGTLRQTLERRVTEQRDKWLADMTSSLDEGRLVRALRLAAHPPDPTGRFPAELAVRLSDAAGAAMNAETTSERWATLLDAVAESPVRRTVKPVALPAEPGEDLLQAARKAAGRVPGLAPLLGITMPPPPGPPRPARPGAPRPRPAGRGPGGPPPPRPAPTAAAQATEDAPEAAAPADGGTPADADAVPTEAPAADAPSMAAVIGEQAPEPATGSAEPERVAGQVVPPTDGETGGDGTEAALAAAAPEPAEPADQTGD
ncbi:MAG TPA: hypothetical protein VFJ97_11215 [Dermatophilaceae bacterium]|nr:hypothetical protein [Dermatophilaceae bacterium]